MIRLEHERTLRGWSQTALAFYTGMHQPDISRIERGVAPGAQHGSEPEPHERFQISVNLPLG